MLKLGTDTKGCNLRYHTGAAVLPHGIPAANAHARVSKRKEGSEASPLAVGNGRAAGPSPGAAEAEEGQRALFLPRRWVRALLPAHGAR